MAIADLDTYLAKLNAMPQRVPFVYHPDGGSGFGDSVKLFWSFWGINGGGGAAPTTAAVPARTIAGAFGQENGASTALRCLYAQLVAGGDTALPPGIFTVADRLSHQGGLVGNVNTLQNTNLPTAALTRYTSGVGVMAALEIYSTIGATLTTFTVSYTNQAGTPGQVSPAMRIGGASPNFNRDAGLMIPVPLATGDTGIRSVESVTLAATTGTAGNLGVTLYKPLLAISLPTVGSEVTYDPFLSGANLGEEILDDACLWPFIVNGGVIAGSSGAFTGQLAFAED